MCRKVEAAVALKMESNWACAPDIGNHYLLYIILSEMKITTIQSKRSPATTATAGDRRIDQRSGVSIHLPVMMRCAQKSALK